MIITSRKDTIHKIPILYWYDRPLVRVYQIASKSIWQKKLYTRYGYKILIFIQFNIDHR